MQQLLPFALYQPGHRDSGPALHDPGDLLIGHPIPKQIVFCRRLNLFLLCLQRLLGLGQPSVFQLRGLFQIIALLRGFDLPVQLLHLLPQLAHTLDGVLFVLPLGLHGIEAVPLLRQLLLELGKPCPGLGILLPLQRRLLDLHLDDLPGYRVQLHGHGVHFRADLGAGLVHQVDGLVRQEPVGDIAVGQGCRADQGGVRNLHAVEHLVALL